MSDFSLMLLADGRLPVGGHTQSAGLEPALLGGLADGDIAAYLVTRLRTVTTVDAATAVCALHALRTGGDALGLVQQHWAARTPSHIQRHASVTLGRGGLRLLRTLAVDHPCTLALALLDAPPRPLVQAALADVLGLDARQLATVVAYDDVQAVCAAALKLAPLDPAEPVRWALDLREEVDALLRRVAGLTDPATIPAPAAPLLESWVHAHAHSTRRLFSA